MDQLTKRRIYAPLETLSISKFIVAMYKRVFSSYGFSIIIINDQENQMTSVLWKQLCQHFDINIKFSLAYHSETDSQIKNANKIIKNYLRAYISHLQEN